MEDSGTKRLDKKFEKASTNKYVCFIHNPKYTNTTLYIMNTEK